MKCIFSLGSPLILCYKNPCTRARRSVEGFSFFLQSVASPYITSCSLAFCWHFLICFSVSEIKRSSCLTLVPLQQYRWIFFYFFFYLFCFVQLLNGKFSALHHSSSLEANAERRPRPFCHTYALTVIRLPSDSFLAWHAKHTATLPVSHQLKSLLNCNYEATRTQTWSDKSITAISLWTHYNRVVSLHPKLPWRSDFPGFLVSLSEKLFWENCARQPSWREREKKSCLLNVRSGRRQLSQSLLAVIMGWDKHAGGKKGN